MLDLAKLDLDDIASALGDQTDYEHRWLIDPGSGDVVLWTSEGGIDGQHPVDIDDLDLIVIDPLPSRVWFRDMADFAARLTDDTAGRRLTRALDGRGAFRRFRAELYDEYPGLIPVWHRFRENRAKGRAVAWLAENSLVTEEAADRFHAEHPDLEVP